MRVAGLVSVLAGTVLVFAPAASAAGTTFAVTRLATGGLPNSVAVDPVTNTVYAGIDNDHEVAVIDGASNAETALIDLPCLPNTVAVDPTSDTMYAICGQNTAAGVYVIDGATNAITTTISLPSTLVSLAAAVNTVTHMLYITDYADGTVIVVNGSTDTVAATIPLADPVLDLKPRPRSIAVDTATNTIYVADLSGSQVEVIDGTTNALIGRIALPASSNPFGVVADPAAGLVYVADEGTGAISVIDAATDSVSTLATGITEPQGLALDAGTGTLYATSSTGSVDNLSTTYVVDTASGAIDAQIPRGGTSAAVLATGGSVYVDGSNDIGDLDSDVSVITPSSVNTMSPVIISLPPGGTITVGQPVQEQLAVSATPAATVAATGLPAGLTLSPSGLLSGTPAAGTGGSYTVSVTAANGVAPSASTVLTLGIDEAPAITSANHVNFTAVSASSFTMTASGWPASSFSETGTLPAGVTLSSDGVLSGMAEVGRYPIVVTATNGVGNPVTQQFTLGVDIKGEPPPVGGVLGDVTGDGLADILAVDGAGNLWLYPNTGSGDQNMFADGRSQVGLGWSGYTLAAVAPLGSTEAGLLTIAPGGNLYYYPNTGRTGTATFDARSLVGTGWAGYTVVGLTDLYGTGQPGILAIDSGGNLWFYPGTGRTGTATFGARSLVGVGWTGYIADVADINGDGSPDLLAVDSAGTMWLYRNTNGGTGTSTFGAPTEPSYGWDSYQAIDVGSLTTGGGTDMLGIDAFGNLYYYPGTGNTTFGTPVLVGDGWDTYRIN